MGKSFNLNENFVIISQHPVTTEYENNEKNILLFNYDPSHNVYRFKLSNHSVIDTNNIFYVEKHISTGSYHQIFKIMNLK